MPLPLPDVRLPDGIRRTELAQGESELGGRSKPTAAATDGASDRDAEAAPALLFGLVGAPGVHVRRREADAARGARAQDMKELAVYRFWLNGDG